MGAIEATVTAIAKHVGAACQLVVVCGRNKKLVQRLEARRVCMRNCPCASGMQNNALLVVGLCLHQVDMLFKFAH